MFTYMWHILLVVMAVNGIFEPYASAKTVLKKLENCESSVSYTLKYSNVTIKTVGDQQYLDLALIIAAPFDDNIRTNATIETLVGKKYEYLFSINEKKSCYSLNKYFGEFAYEMERYAQIIPGICPIPEGRYQMHNAPMNFDKLVTMRVFPFGRLRMFLNLYNKNNSLYSCAVIELENFL